MYRVVSQKMKRGLTLAAMAAAMFAAGCGGGTSQIDPFAPKRIVAFGDETGALTATGKKYGINGLDATTNLLDCRQNPNWAQSLATGFGMVYTQCNLDGQALPQGVMLAAAGDKVADVRDKIDQYLTNDGLGPKDLVAIFVGANDILELYRQFPAQSRDALLNDAKARGKLLADQANRIANGNGRVIVSTVYDLGLSPFGQNEKVTQTDIDRAVFLTDLTTAFNISLRLNLLNDGRYIGLVLTDETIQQMSRFPTAFGLTDVAHAACRTDVAITDCNPNTLQADASATTWMWASDTLLGPTAQGRIGVLALSRARNNPF